MVRLLGIGIRLAAVSLVAVITVSCAAIRPEHCPYANWNATGELHASKGFQSRLPSLIDTCLQVGVLPDAEAYLAGYQRGLLGFCTIENGWVWGKSRDVNPNICPPALSSGFDRGFEARSTLEQLEIEEANLKTERDELEFRISEGDNINYETIRRLREVNRELDQIDSERRRTRIGFAAWLKAHGLEAPEELFSY